MCRPAISLAFSILPFPFALVVLGLGLRHHPTPFRGHSFEAHSQPRM